MSIKRLSSFVSIAALVFGLQGPAMAGVVISGDYYEQSEVSNDCTNQLGCRVNFEPIPADKRVDIRYINCQIAGGQPIYSLAMGATAILGGFSNRRMYFPVQTTLTSTNVYFSTANDETAYLISASRYLYFEVATNAAANTTIKCSVIGRITPR